MLLSEKDRDYLTEKIAAQGYTPIIYHDEALGVTAVTTVGLTHRGWPELMVNSAVINVDGLLKVIAYVLEFWEECGRATEGFMPPILYNGHEVVYDIALMSTEHEKWGALLYDYYTADGFCPLVAQIIYPDNEGNHPGDEDYQNYLGQITFTKRVH